MQVFAGCSTQKLKVRLGPLEYADTARKGHIGLSICDHSAPFGLFFILDARNRHHYLVMEAKRELEKVKWR